MYSNLTGEMNPKSVRWMRDTRLRYQRRYAEPVALWRYRRSNPQVTSRCGARFAWVMLL